MLNFIFSNIFYDFSLLKVSILIFLTLCCLFMYFMLKKLNLSNEKFNVISDLLLFLVVSLWIFSIFHIHYAVVTYIIFSITIGILKKKNLLSRFYRVNDKAKECNNKKVSYSAYMLGFIVNSIIMFIYDTPLYNSGYESLVIFSNVIHATGILCAIFIFFHFIASILPYPYSDDNLKLQLLFVLLCIIFYTIAIVISFN